MPAEAGGVPNGSLPLAKEEVDITLSLTMLVCGITHGLGFFDS